MECCVWTSGHMKSYFYRFGDKWAFLSFHKAQTWKKQQQSFTVCVCVSLLAAPLWGIHSEAGNVAAVICNCTSLLLWGSVWVSFPHCFIFTWPATKENNYWYNPLKLVWSSKGVLVPIKLHKAVGFYPKAGSGEWTIYCSFTVVLSQTHVQPIPVRCLATVALCSMVKQSPIHTV